jgi:hypothetical protein
MIAAAVGNDRYLLLTSNDDPDASFVGIVGSMGRMERDDANDDDDDDAASYVYESRNVERRCRGGRWRWDATECAGSEGAEDGR